MADIGHNSVPRGEVADELKHLVERIERLTEEKKALQGDISAIYGEAKSTGFDTRTIRKIVKLRAMDATKRAEEEMLLETYRTVFEL